MRHKQPLNNPNMHNLYVRQLQDRSNNPASPRGFKLLWMAIFIFTLPKQTESLDDPGEGKEEEIVRHLSSEACLNKLN